VGQGTKPTATIVTSPASPIIGQAINFNGSTSIAAPGRVIRSWNWDFGDGASGSGPQVSHAYANSGSYTVVLTVTDDAGRVGTATVTISVGTGNPTADFTFNPSAPRSGQQVTFDASASQAASGRTIVSYSWSFGNGNSGTGPTVTTTFTTGVTPTTYNVLLTVTDSAGKTSSITKPITINP
jgi:PKD repeat protein